MKTLLSKQRIATIKRTATGDIHKLCLMAEQQRQYTRQKTKRAKQKPKKYLKSTDYLTSEQFARVLSFIISKADIDRKRTQAQTRAILNEMLIILLAETGLRASEAVNLKLRNLPSYHGKPEIEVEEGKGNKDRTIGISDYLVQKLNDYVKKYHKLHSAGAAVFYGQQGALTYKAIYKRIKTIGNNCGVRLKPHIFRHTFATLLLDVTDNQFLIKNQLGHDNLATTTIYTRTLNQKLRSAMGNFHNRLWQSYNTVLFDNRS
ncbi:MAG: site-specific integrase [Phycisphaerae bacterium]|nr:site-specific integrase [Phycisphaerae bacterium]